jgi:ribosomal protein S18 acetylase RimI-like enzyme
VTSIVSGIGEQKSFASELEDDEILAAFFRRDEPLHIYELGDLDPFHRADARYFGWMVNGAPAAVALLYSGSRVPALLLFEREDVESARSLLDWLLASLSAPLYLHVSSSLAEHARGAEAAGGSHYKMLLTDVAKLASSREEGVVRLSARHESELVDFYEEHYPEHWFDPPMLACGKYFGAFDDGRIAAVAGVHVYSERDSVAALGNIATAITHRRRGLSRLVTARLCRDLLESVHTIGLNVHVDNEAALRCYRSLGFEIVARYEELAIGAA